MSNELEFTIEVMPAPERQRMGIYDMVVASFLEKVADGRSKIKSARVTMPNRSIKTAQIGLTKAARLSGHKGLKVRLYNNELWLEITKVP